MGREDTLVTLVRDRLRLHQGPPSRRLAGALADLAQTGLISPGTRLPSERDLAQAVGVSRGRWRRRSTRCARRGCASAGTGAARTCSARPRSAVSSRRGPCARTCPPPWSPTPRTSSCPRSTRRTC
ncbi:hypothetical protein ACFQ0B_34090 [Nonomuraea thailandensis]